MIVETMLIIEDEKLLGSELSRHYRQSGWDVLLASTLAEAKEILLKKKLLYNNINQLIIILNIFIIIITKYLLAVIVPEHILQQITVIRGIRLQ